MYTLYLQSNLIYSTLLLLTALAVQVQQLAVSVRLSVRSFSICRLNRLTFELEFLCVWVLTIAHLVLKVTVIGRGHKSMSSACGCGNAVTRSV